MTPGELPQLVRYAELFDRRASLMADLALYGYATDGSRGQRVIAPEATALAAVETELRQLERQLGLGPAHRAKLAIDILSAEAQLRNLNRPFATGGPTIAQLKEAQNGNT